MRPTGWMAGWPAQLPTPVTFVGDVAIVSDLAAVLVQPLRQAPTPAQHGRCSRIERSGVRRGRHLSVDGLCARYCAIRRLAEKTPAQQCCSSSWAESHSFRQRRSWMFTDGDRLVARCGGPPPCPPLVAWQVPRPRQPDHPDPRDEASRLRTIRSARRSGRPRCGTTGRWGVPWYARPQGSWRHPRAGASRRVSPPTPPGVRRRSCPTAREWGP